MTQRVALTILAISLLGPAAVAQQNVTISPGDDVIAILETVVDDESTITFEPGYYLITPKADGAGHGELLTPGFDTVVRGAGSGFDPETATIIDLAYTFDSAIAIEEAFSGITVEGFTFLHALDEHIQVGAGSFDNTINDVWAFMSSGDGLVRNEGGDIAFNFCAFGWTEADVIHTDAASVTVMTNCDLVLGDSDIVEAEADAQLILRNCIVYAGNGANDIEVDGGLIVVRASVGWDPFDGDPPGFEPGIRLGRIDLNGDPDVDDTNTGEDPLYVRQPGPSPDGPAYKMSEIDLHLQEGSPALTAGSTSFDDNHNPTGDPMYAGSQGLAEPIADVTSWSVF